MWEWACGVCVPDNRAVWLENSEQGWGMQSDEVVEMGRGKLQMALQAPGRNSNGPDFGSLLRTINSCVTAGP